MTDISNLRNTFEVQFGSTPARLFWAPGRLNLIGEHTDYNDGFVLPMALDRGTLVAARARPDRVLRIHSANINETAEFDMDRSRPRAQGKWTDYVFGVALALGRRTAPLTGADLAISSDIPIGAGLSSSAALELSVGLALSTISGLKIEPLTLALIGQESEHDFVGIKCGIMDQYTASFGRRGNALLIDCRSLTSRLIPLQLGDHEIVVCDSHVMHTLASSEYNQRRSQCEQALAVLKQVLPGISSLRDVTVRDFESHRELLGRQIRRRCRHVVTEDERTLAAAEALESGDLAKMGRLMTQSHASLRDDYEVSCPELDLLVDTALSVEGVLGARMTGGGFGGCTVNLVHLRSIDRFANTIESEYLRVVGKSPSIYRFKSANGAHEINV
ncbi:MAG TPA: galactokinase [Blastocatellia bacterium]